MFFFLTAALRRVWDSNYHGEAEDATMPPKHTIDSPANLVDRPNKALRDDSTDLQPLASLRLARNAKYNSYLSAKTVEIAMTHARAIEELAITSALSTLETKLNYTTSYRTVEGLAISSLMSSIAKNHDFCFGGTGHPARPSTPASIADDDTSSTYPQDVEQSGSSPNISDDTDCVYSYDASPSYAVAASASHGKDGTQDADTTDNMHQDHETLSHAPIVHTTRHSIFSAVHEVLNTVELLELILLQLPMADLLLCQHISRQFRDVIASSIHLQRLLYFKPHACGPVAIDRSHANHHLMSHFTALNPSRVPEPACLEPNPLLLKYFKGWPLAGFSACASLWPPPVTVDIAKMAGWLDEDFAPSWSKALVSQPPCSEATVYYWWDGKLEAVGVQGGDEGLTMGQLVGGIVQCAGDLEYCLDMDDEGEEKRVETLICYIRFE